VFLCFAGGHPVKTLPKTFSDMSNSMFFHDNTSQKYNTYPCTIK
jgi:hypothetical protein